MTESCLTMKSSIASTQNYHGIDPCSVFRIRLEVKIVSNIDLIKTVSKINYNEIMKTVKKMD